MYAAQKGDEARVEWLLKRGAQLELADSDGYTALLNATNGNHVGVVRLLLSKGASTVSEVEKGIKNPLHAACYSGYAEVARALLENGASSEASASINGLSVKPLLLACIAATSKAGYNVDTIRVLLEMGADTEAVYILSTGSPFRPMDVACQHGHVEVVAALLRSGALVTLGNIQSFASSASASDSGAYSVLLELLSRIPAGSGAARAAVFAALAGR
jgi:ankyrin repeat protein